MPVIKLTLSEEYYTKLKEMANGEPLQDYIRSVLFDEATIFTPEEAIIRAKEKFEVNTEFSLPEVYGEMWTLDRGPAGAFGKRFYNYLRERRDSGIEFSRMDDYNRRAMYIIKGDEENE